MANDKDFKVKNGIKPTVYHEAVGTVTSGSEGYNLSSGSYETQYVTSTQDTVPAGVSFKSDGMAFYIIGFNTDTVYQYTLSTAWDVSTASYASKSFSVATQDTLPYKVKFKSDGTKMYMVGITSNTVYQYTLSTAWDISTASYDSVSFSVSTQATSPVGLDFSSDGTSMYVLQFNGSTFQYTLSTSWDLSTASYASKSFTNSSGVNGEYGLAFKSDGTKMYVVGISSDTVSQYSLSTAWDISTASSDNVSLSVVSQEDQPRDVTLSSDGTKLYVSGSGSTTGKVVQYSIVTNTATLDLSTGSVFELTPTSDIQVTLGNPAASGTVSGATLLLSASGTAYTITYDPIIQWAGGTAPTSPAIGDKDVLTFTTRDGGTTYSAALAIDGAQ